MLLIILGINIGMAAICAVIVAKMLQSHNKEMNRYKAFWRA